MTNRKRNEPLNPGGGQEVNDTDLNPVAVPDPEEVLLPAVPMRTWTDEQGKVHFISEQDADAVDKIKPES